MSDNQSLFKQNNLQHYLYLSCDFQQNRKHLQDTEQTAQVLYRAETTSNSMTELKPTGGNNSYSLHQQTRTLPTSYGRP